jgi:DNA-binding GntR family transcriptional regulator
LPPGSIIDEGKLQTELNLGRTPIREALLKLSVEKLVTIIPRRGIFVSEISIPHLQQLFELRLSLEPLAARLAAQRGTIEQFEAIAKALAVDNPLRSMDEAFTQADQACHHIIYEAASNKYLEDTLLVSYTLSVRLWNYARVKIADLEMALSQHRKILSALEKRDVELAGEFMEEHVQNFQDEIQNAMLRIAN